MHSRVLRLQRNVIPNFPSLLSGKGLQGARRGMTAVRPRAFVHAFSTAREALPEREREDAKGKSGWTDAGDQPLVVSASHSA